MLKITMDHPTRDEELVLAGRMLGRDSPEAVLNRGAVRAVIHPEDLAELRSALSGILLRDELLGYIVDLVRATRTHEAVLVGGGPRATQALLLSSRVQAALAGRDFVTPDDVKTMLFPVLDHRLILRPEHELEGLTAREVIHGILEEVSVPR